MLFDNKVLWEALEQIKPDNVKGEYYLTDAIETARSRGGRVEAVLVEDYTEMLGINTVGELGLVRKIYTRRKKDEDNQRRVEDGIHRKRKRR